jgi:chromosome segregation protein
LLDSLIHRAQRVRSSGSAHGLPPAAGAASAASPAEAESIPCPGEGSQVEEEWLREERLSLTEFTRRQFQAIREQQAHLEAQRQDLLRRQNDFNETCLLKQQELNRQVKVLAAQGAALDAREKDLTESEKKLAVEEQRIGRTRKDLLQFRQEMADQEKELAEKKAEAEHLLKAAEGLDQKHADESAALREQRQTLQAERERFEQRQRAVELAEAALTRERAEVQLLKGVLDKDIAERNLDSLRQQTLAQQERLEASSTEAKRMQAAAEEARKGVAHLEEALESCRRRWQEEEAAWEGRRRQMEHRCLALERAEAVLERRTTELERLDAKIQEEQRRTEQELSRQRQELEDKREELFGRCFAPGNGRVRSIAVPEPAST